MAEVTRDDVLMAKIATTVAKETAAAMVEAQSKFQAVENRNAPPRRWNETPGKVRPVLSRKTFFCGSPQQEIDLSDEEIELFNQITPGRYNGRRWDVIERTEGIGEPATIEVRIPGIQNRDLRVSLPSLVDLLKQIIDEAKKASK